MTDSPARLLVDNLRAWATVAELEEYGTNLVDVLTEAALWIEGEWL